MSKSYIHPISLKTEKPVYRKPTKVRTKQRLEEFLTKKGLNIKLHENLKGGVDSAVYAAILDNKSVVVKHTEDRSFSLFSPPFSPVDYFVPRENQNLDTKILKLLSRTEIRIPRIIRHYPKETITVMEDLRDTEGTLLQEGILNAVIPLSTASNLGKNLRLLNRTMAGWKKVKTYKETNAQIFERGLELRLFYPNDQSHYLELEERFLNNSSQLIWPDGHPKNIFYWEDGSTAFIDFGGCTYGDPDYILPNFLGQFLVFALSGYLGKKFTIDYSKNLIGAYEKAGGKKIDESIFIKYLGMEVLHRSSGKWLIGITETDQKINCIKFGLTLFDNKIIKLNDLYSLLAKFL